MIEIGVAVGIWAIGALLFTQLGQGFERDYRGRSAGSASLSRTWAVPRQIALQFGPVLAIFSRASRPKGL